MTETTLEPDSTAVRVALWRAMHVQVDPPPHVVEDEIGLQLAAPDADWRSRADMDEQATSRIRASIVARARFIEDLVTREATGGVGNAESADFINAVVERWRGATMSYRSNRDDPELGTFTEPPPLQSAALDSERFRILKRPAAADPLRTTQAPATAPGQPTRWPTR